MLHRFNTCQSSDLFSEETFSLTHSAAGEEGREGARWLKDKIFPLLSLLDAPVCFHIHLTPGCKVCWPTPTAAMKILTTAWHRDPDTTRVAAHPQDILHYCCTSLPAVPGEWEWKCLFPYVQLWWLLTLPSHPLINSNNSKCIKHSSINIA